VHRKLGGKRVANYEQWIIIFSMEKDSKIINREQNFLYNIEQYQQLREKNFLVIGFCIQF